MNRLLFWTSLGLAGVLCGLVFLAPLVADSSRVAGLFAHDATLRQTALASAAGLAVTACVFFRSRGRQGRSLRRRPGTRSSGPMGA